MASTDHTPAATMAKEPAPAYKAQFADGLHTAATKWGCSLGDEEIDPKFKYEGKNSTRLGNRPIEEQTKINYEGCYRQLWRYCIITGNYDDMLALLSPCPENAPSIQMETVEAFLRFKRKKAGTPLMDSNNQQPIKDIFNAPLQCEGGWKAPKNADIYKAAITDLHKAHGERDGYRDACDDCRGLPTSRRHRGCERHSGEPQIHRSGDPTNHETFENTMTQLKKDDHDYEECGSSQLLPSDLRLLRARLLSSNCIIGLQTYVIILVAIWIFLRHDEFHDIEMDQFQMDMHEVFEDKVEALVLKVFGKADKTWVTLKLWFNHEYPELCPVRHLLVYLYLTGIKSGYLFPSEKELLHPPANGHFTTTINYGTFMRQLKTLCEEVLPEREDLKVGCHVFRKTGYLVAVFGNALHSALRQSARHESENNSLKYYEDALSQYETHRRSPNPMNNVSEWKPVLIKQARNSRVLAVHAGCKLVPIAELGKHFVEKILRVNPTERAVFRTPLYLIKQAIDYQAGTSAAEVFRQFLQSLPADKCEEGKRLAMRWLEDRMKTLPNASAVVDAQSSETEIESSRKRHKPDAPSKSKKNDLEKRKELGNLSGNREKVQLMLELEKQYTRTSELTSGAKTFVTKFLTPMLGCLRNHCGGSVDCFCLKWPDFQHTTFPTVCCAGRGDACAAKSKTVSSAQP